MMGFRPSLNILPIEIRLLIWNFALPGPRSVQLDIVRPTDITNVRGVDGKLTGQYVYTTLPAERPNAPLPITLFINQESRYETLRRYQIVYPRQIGPQYFSTPFCFDPQIDTVHLMHRSFIGDSASLETWLTILNLSLQRGLSCIQHLEIYSPRFETIVNLTLNIGVQNHNVMDRVILRHPGLRTLTLTYGEFNSYADWRDYTTLNVNAFISAQTLLSNNARIWLISNFMNFTNSVTLNIGPSAAEAAAWLAQFQLTAPNTI